MLARIAPALALVFAAGTAAGTTLARTAAPTRAPRSHAARAVRMLADDVPPVDDEERLSRTLAVLQAELGQLTAEREAIGREIERKRVVQRYVLDQLGAAYSRSILEQRKAALLSEVRSGAPSGKRVALLVDSLLAACASEEAAKGARAGSWKLAYPPPGFFDRLFGGGAVRLPPGAVVVDPTVAVCPEGAYGAPSVYTAE